MNAKRRLIGLLLLTMPITANAGVLAPSAVEKITPASGQSFGSNIAADATTIAIASQGAPGQNTAGGRSVQIFRKSGVNWNPVKLIQKTDFARDFGKSLALSGDLLAVGAPYRETYYANSSASIYPGIGGRVYLYRRTTSGAEDWVEEASIETAAANDDFAYFGDRVQLSGDTLAVSAGGYETDRIRIYRRISAGTWTAAAAIVPPEPPGSRTKGDVPYNQNFRLSGNFLVTGPWDGPAPNYSSELLVYERNTGGSNAWGLFQRVNAWTSRTDGYLEAGIGFSGNRIACRAVQRGAEPGAGFVIFERPATAGALFSLAHRRLQATTVSPIGIPLLINSGSNLPVEVAGESVALVSAIPSGNRVRTKAEVYTRAAAGWDAAVAQTVLAGFTRQYPRMPAAMLPGIIILGTQHPFSETFHTRGSIEIFDGVSSPGFFPFHIILNPSTAPGSGRFGEAMDMQSNYLVAGDPGDDTTLQDSGQVHVWRRTESSDASAGEYWKPALIWKPSISHEDGIFGDAVAYCGGDIAAGEPGEPTGGQVHMHTLSYGTELTLTRPASIDAGDRFGGALASDNTWLAVGAPGDENGGSVHIYYRTVAGAPWTFLKSLAKPAAIDTGDNFGATLSMDGETLVVTATFDESAGGGSYDGSAFIYMQNQGGINAWGLVTTAPIKPSDTTRGIFGYSASVRGDELIVGSWPFAIFGVGRGEAFTFSRNQGGTNRWGEVKPLFYATSFSANPGYGASVALSPDGRIALVGAPQDDFSGNDRGSAGVYDRDSNGVRQWSEVSFLEPWVPTTTEYCATAVAASGDALAASAPRDDTGGTDAGAIYVWRLGAYERWACETGIVGAVQMPPTGDYDRDGVANLMEFAIGADPRNPRSRDGGLVIQREADGLLHLRLTKPSYPTTGLEWKPEHQRRRFYESGPTRFDFWESGFTGMTRISDTATSLNYVEAVPPVPLGDISYNIAALARLEVTYPNF